MPSLDEHRVGQGAERSSRATRNGSGSQKEKAFEPSRRDRSVEGEPWIVARRRARGFAASTRTSSSAEIVSNFRASHGSSGSVYRVAPDHEEAAAASPAHDLGQDAFDLP